MQNTFTPTWVTTAPLHTLCNLLSAHHCNSFLHPTRLLTLDVPTARYGCSTKMVVQLWCAIPWRMLSPQNRSCPFRWRRPGIFVFASLAQGIKSLLPLNWTVMLMRNCDNWELPVTLAGLSFHYTFYVKLFSLVALPWIGYSYQWHYPENFVVS